MDEMWVRLVSFLEALAPDTFHRALSLCVFICRWFDVRSCRRSDSQPSVVLQKKIPRLPPEHEHLKQLQCFEFFKVSLVGAPSRAVLMGTSAAVVCLYPGVLINSSTAATLTAGSRNVTMWLCSSEERNADAPSLNHTKHGYLRRIKCHLCVYVPFVIPDDTHTHTRRHRLRSVYVNICVCFQQSDQTLIKLVSLRNKQTNVWTLDTDRTEGFWVIITL